MEKNRKIRPERLDDFKNLYYDAFGYGEGRDERAAEFFGVPASECKKWHDERPHPVAHRYLQVHCKGYLPYNTNWKECRIREDGMVMTPWGNCMPSDMAFLHRNKWSAEQTRRQLASYRKKLEDLQSGSKAKMALHTADYLARLLNELLTTD